MAVDLRDLGLRNRVDVHVDDHLAMAYAGHDPLAHRRAFEITDQGRVQAVLGPTLDRTGSDCIPGLALGQADDEVTI